MGIAGEFLTNLMQATERFSAAGRADQEVCLHAYFLTSKPPSANRQLLISIP